MHKHLYTCQLKFQLTRLRLFSGVHTDAQVCQRLRVDIISTGNTQFAWHEKKSLTSVPNNLVVFYNCLSCYS